MPTRLTALLAGSLLLGITAPAFAADAFKVSIRVEGKAKTLVEERKVELADAPIIKDGNPDHSCNGQRAIGALQAGTQGKWSGKWFEGLGYSADTILGSKPKTPGYYELWINNRLSSKGLCDATLRAGYKVLMFVQDCTYDPKLERCKNPVTPLSLRMPTAIRKGKVRTLTVLDRDANGKATPEPNATVYFNDRRSYKTDSKGQVHFKALSSGLAEVYATKKGKVRTETTTVRVAA